MSETITWWVVAQVVGLAALPLCLTLFRRLPDRGYALSKPFALLLVGYLFWILNILHVLPNSVGGIVWALIFLAAGSGIVVWRRRDDLLAFARAHWWLIGVTEAIFLLTFVTAAFLRSYVPEIAGTEKPMDFMFLNAVIQADNFPPADPWLAGESVSYYYFGYLLISVMTRLSGVAPAIGFNLGLALIVAMTVTAAFSIVYNLAAPRERRLNEAGPGTPAAGFTARPLVRPMIFGLVAALLLAVMGNLEGMLEWLASHNVGGSGFWSFVGVANLVPSNSAQWFPDQFWFWWRATRILDGGVGIHEFPFFSFLLGDLHPHVMVIPFVLLAIGAALSLLRSEGPLDIVYWLERPLALVALGVILGGLAFLNTWDMPTIAFIIVLIALLRNRLLAGRWSWGLAGDTAGFVVPLMLVAFLAYTPFYFGGFDSQASGFTAEAGAGSGLFHTFLLWGPFAAIVLPYAIWRLTRGGRPLTSTAVLWSLMPALAIVLAWLAWDGLASVSGALPNLFALNDGAAGFWSRVGARDWNWLTVAVLAAVLGLLVLALAREVERTKNDDEGDSGHVFALALSATAALLILGAEFFYIQDFFGSRLNTIFKLYYQAWLLLSIAGGFALYELARGFQMPKVTVPRRIAHETSLGGWSLGEGGVIVATFATAVLGIVLMEDALTRFIGAFALGGVAFIIATGALALWRSAEPQSDGSRVAITWRSAWAGGVALFVLAGFAYPLLATFNRTNNFDQPRSLDGLAYLERSDPDQLTAIAWLRDQEGQPVVAEAIGRPYDTNTSRVSAVTGFPTILGWPGHESQWRGGYEEQEGRPEDLQLLYTSTDPDQVRAVLQKYDVAFVYVGPAERQQYGELAVPQTALMEPAFEQGDVTIYRVRPGILGEGVTTSP
ncbi:MAG: hypothetical protein IH958_01210 [Chloroflexi bacterium]|nr:hypothetical protein [Chloroflexota bacterium]